jgi:hypothetical protein
MQFRRGENPFFDFKVNYERRLVNLLTKIQNFVQILLANFDFLILQRESKKILRLYFV